MSKKQQFVVIGLGRFGKTVAEELVRLGHDVLGIDNDKELVESLADMLTRVAVADASDEKVLEELDIKQFDAALVAIGENIEASILTTLALKSVGVKKVWVKALNDAHHRIIAKLDADRIIHPEFEMGMKVAQSLDRPEVVNYLALGGDNFIVEIEATESLDDINMGELRLKVDGRVQILALRHGSEVSGHPQDHIRMRTGDHLVLMGKLNELKRMSDLMMQPKPKANA